MRCRQLSSRAPISHRRVARLLAVLVTLLASACGNDPVAGVRVPSPPAAAPPTSPRLVGGWIEESARVVGDVSGGTIVLRGEKRWLVSSRGLEPETVAAPLVRALVVPTSRGPVMVGDDGVSVFRFDDPLGPGTLLHRSNDWIASLGSMPGLVHVVPDDVYVDVLTGAAGDARAFSIVPPRSVVFADARRGMAYLGGLDAYVRTSDGGATWTEHTRKPLGAGRVSPNGRGVTLLEGSRGQGFGLHYVPAETIDLLADVAPRAERPLIAWIGATRLDPLSAAVVRGVPFGPERALVTEFERLALVDLKTGDVDEIVDAPSGCSLATSTAGPIALCNGVELAIRDEPLRLERRGKAGEGGVESTPSGGVAATASCKADAAKFDRDVICVRQPDGSWASMRAKAPRADGRGLDARVVDGVAEIELVEPKGSGGNEGNGGRTTLARAPKGYEVVALSEDPERRVWVLAAEPEPGPASDRRFGPGPRTFHLGELVGNELQWTKLGIANDCDLRGSMTVASTDDAVVVRAHPRLAPVRIPIDRRIGRNVSVGPLGFSVGSAMHLGFEDRGPLPVDAPGPQPDPGAERGPRRRLDCDLTSPSRPLGWGPYDATWKLPSGRAGAGLVRWKQDGSSLRVHYLDVGTPSTDTKETTFTLPRGFKLSYQPDVSFAVHQGRVALFFGDDMPLLFRSAAGAAPLPVEVSAFRLDVWLGDDGSVVARKREEHNGTVRHWAPGNGAATSAELGPVAAIGGLDATGYTLLETGRGVASRARLKAAPGTVVALALGDFQREDAKVPGGSQRIPTCAKGATGERFTLPMDPLEVRFDGVEHAEVREAFADLLIDRGVSCIARLSLDATRPDETSRHLRLDFTRDVGDAIEWTKPFTRRAVRCRLEP